jgi:hypothetical protein
MSSDDRTADDFLAHWLTPSQAVGILDEAYKTKGVAKEALLECLRGSRVQAVSANATFNGTRTWGEAFYKIPAEDWERVDWNDTFWTTGILRYQRREYGRSDIVTVRHFNVRFEPYSVHAIVKATAAPAGD